MWPTLFALACNPGDPAAGVDSASDADPGGERMLDTPAAPTYSGEACPTLVDGVNEFTSAGIAREVRVQLPADPNGAPVLFGWHWLGGSAQQVIRSLELGELSESDGVIVVAPESRESEAYEWDFLSGPEGNADAILFDDLVACLHQQYAIDLDRVHATGMSAGGLWTTWLTVYRSDLLASTAPFSGGLTAYISPAEPIPVMLTWGGPTDTYGGFSFDDANASLQTGLAGDGHFVVACEHSRGHSIPSDAGEYLWPFLRDHPRSNRTEPYLDGLPEVFPDYCVIPGR